LVAVGNRKPGQAVDQAMEALASLPAHVHLAFVGRFHEGAVETARRFGVEGRVHPVGAVAPEEVVPFIRSADAALIPYWPETGNYENILPNGFFQSLSAHLPLLWPPLPDLVGLVGDRPVGRTMDPRDPAAIAAGVQWLIDNPAEAGYAREAVRQLADQVCWEREEEKLGLLVTQVLERGRP
jgi:glycosyltransferase involved in cell wall biosynthesis